MYAEEANNIITQLQSLRPEVQKVAIDTIIAYRKATDANNQVFRQVAANDPIYLTDAEKSA